MMKKSIFLFVSIGLLLIDTGVYAQYNTISNNHEITKPITDATSPSPEAASLGKYIDQPVGYYSGIPQINIPIYELDAGAVKVPVSISYHASGIKVSEEATCIGLGWSLNAGGIITQYVNGRDDNTATGFANQWSVELPGESILANQFDYYTQVTYSVPCECEIEGIDENFSDYYIDDIDMQPDVFVYNFNGYSGRFFFDREGNIIVSDYSPIVFEFFSGANRWIATTPDGTKYIFDTIQYTITLDWESTSLCPYNSVSYYLNQIRTVTGDTITFTYLEEYSLIRPIPAYTEIYRHDLYDMVFPENISHIGAGSQYSTVHMKEIIFRGNRIRFNYKSRTDIPGEKALSSVHVYHNNDEILIDSLCHSYFEYDSKYGNYLYASPSEWPAQRLGQRLRLDKIIKNTEEVHKFDYYTTHKLPYHTGYAIDFWGYFNGVINFTSESDQTKLIPDFDAFETIVLPDALTSYHTDIDRYPSLEYAQTATLKKIIYPTKGSREFIYELNEYNNPTYENLWETNLFDSTCYDRNLPSEPLYHGDPIILEVDGDPWTETNVRISLTFEGLSYDPGKFNYVTFKSVGSSSVDETWIYNNIYEQLVNNRITYYLNLLPGTYEFQSHLDDAYGPQPLDMGPYKAVIIRLVCNKPVTKKTKFKGPGLRIAQIITKDNTGSTSIQKFEYGYTDANNVSHTYGKLMSPLLLFYYRDGIINDEDCLHPNPDAPYCSISQSFQRSIAYSNTCIPSATTPNNTFIGYNKVKSYITSPTENGYTEYEYHNIPDIYIHIDNRPEIPTIPDQLSGKPISETYYKYIGNQPLMVKKVNYTYDDHDFSPSGYDLQGNKFIVSNFGKVVYGMIVTDKITEVYGSRCYGSGCRGYFFTLYPLIGYRLDLSEKKTTDYSDDGNSIFFRTVYNYNLSGMVSEITEYGSDNATENQYFKYPTDYTNATGIPSGNTEAYAIQKMNEWNMINTPVESYKKAGSLATGGTIQSYRFYNNMIVPYRNYRYETINPASNYTPSAIVSQNLNMDSKYKAVTELNTDNYGNIIQIRSLDNDVEYTSFVWGYNYTLPIAKITNATFGDVKTALGKAPSDNLLYLQNYTDEEIRPEIDKIRSNISSAIVTTYTYKPLIGVTSITDERGFTTYYDYDDLGRLKYIRDFSGKILQRYEYNYAP